MENLGWFCRLLGLERLEKILGLGGIGKPPSQAEEPLNAARRGTGDRLLVEAHFEYRHSSSIGQTDQ
jgi:hypothetical protein